MIHGRLYSTGKFRPQLPGMKTTDHTGLTDGQREAWKGIVDKARADIAAHTAECRVRDLAEIITPSVRKTFWSAVRDGKS